MFCALRPNLAAAVASTSTSAEQAVASFSVFNAATPTENVRPLSLTRAAAAAAAASVALPVMLFAYLLCSFCCCYWFYNLICLLTRNTAIDLHFWLLTAVTRIQCACAGE